MVSAQDSRIGVIGGSIAGCAAAIAAQRAGYEVTVHERSDGELAGRGFGIALSPAVYDDLTGAGYLSRQATVVPLTSRLWVTRETVGTGWRELWRQDLELVSCNWGQLWRSLRSAVPDQAYRAPQPVEVVHPGDGAQAMVRVAEHSDVPYDLVVGADGHRSVVRDAVAGPGAATYAGYVAFRGVLGLDQLADDPQTTHLLATCGLTALFDGGHVIVYVIPGEDGLLVNWVLYTRPPHKIGIDPHRGSFGKTAAITEIADWVRAVARDRLPEQINRMIARTPASATGLQPVIDRPAQRTGTGRVVLAGDANAVARPHTASGAVKALQDAMALEEVLRSNPSIPDAVTAFDERRRPAANQLVELGRRIGRDQVERTPDWSTMTAESLGAHVAATWAGQRHYLHDGESTAAPEIEPSSP